MRHQVISSSSESDMEDDEEEAARPPTPPSSLRDSQQAVTSDGARSVLSSPAARQSKQAAARIGSPAASHPAMSPRTEYEGELAAAPSRSPAVTQELQHTPRSKEGSSGPTEGNLHLGTETDGTLLYDLFLDVLFKY